MKPWMTLAVLALSACEYPRVVKSVYVEAGELYQERCTLRGNRMVDCETEPVMTIASAPTDVPRELDRSAVNEVLGHERPEARCGLAEGAFTVKVMPGGQVDEVTIVEGTELSPAGCVANAIRTMRFPQSQRGGTFTYRPPPDSD
jgi:hypothetical protein